MNKGVFVTRIYPAPGIRTGEELDWLELERLGASEEIMEAAERLSTLYALAELQESG
jgi:hypothetical protein